MAGTRGRGPDCRRAPLPPGATDIPRPPLAFPFRGTACRPCAVPSASHPGLVLGQTVPWTDSMRPCHVAVWECGRAWSPSWQRLRIRTPVPSGSGHAGLVTARRCPCNCAPDNAFGRVPRPQTARAEHPISDWNDSCVYPRHSRSRNTQTDHNGCHAAAAMFPCWCSPFAPNNTGHSPVTHTPAPPDCLTQARTSLFS